MVDILFRSDADNSERRRLLVFVTPRILNPAQSARLAQRFKADYRETVRTSGMKAAEDL